MKILHIVQTLKMGGIEKLVFTMAQADLSNVYVLAIEGDEEQSVKAWPMLASCKDNLFFANKKQGFKTDVITNIRKICNNHAISLIHTHHIGPLLYASLATAMMKHIRHVHTEHDAWHLNYWKNKYIQTVLLKLNKKINLVAVSQHVSEKLKILFPKKDISLIRNAVDTKRFQPGDKLLARSHLNLPTSCVILGTAGRLEEVKGQRFLIDAMLLLPNNFYLAISGQGSLHKTLLQQISSLGLSDRVKLLGGLEEMEVFYQACDVMCLPSLHEGLPLSLLEAQACDIPVVSSDVGGCYEGVDPDSGTLVPSMDAEAIASACLSSLQKAVKPRDFVLKNFSFESLLDKYNQLYMKNL